jgi:hypothetical protein
VSLRRAALANEMRQAILAQQLAQAELVRVRAEQALATAVQSRTEFDQSVKEPTQPPEVKKEQQR